MQRVLRFFRTALVVLAISGLLITVFIPQNAAALNCPSFIRNCNQCSCVGYQISVVDLLKAIRCIGRPLSYDSCNMYNVDGRGRVTFRF